MHSDPFPTLPECRTQVAALTDTERLVSVLVLQLRQRALIRLQADLAAEIRAVSEVNIDGQPPWN